MMNNFPQVVVGTYEEFVVGYKIQTQNENDLKLIQNFASHTHQASIRCIASYGKFLATSGADEYINIYNMGTMEVSYVLNYHDATVTCLEFTPDGSHLITANQKGQVAIFRCRDWQLVKLWDDTHKTGNGVIGTSVHPTGRLLLTIGGDNILRFWNLIKGRLAYANNLSKKCSPGNDVNIVKWSKDGNYYSTCIGKKAEINLVDTACIIYKVECSTKISSMNFLENGMLCLGTDDGFIELHRIDTKSLLHKEKCHDARIKCLESFNLAENSECNSRVQKYIVSADSKGIVKLWRIKKKKPKYFLKLRSEVNVDCRVTCLTTVSAQDLKEENTEIAEALDQIFKTAKGHASLKSLNADQGSKHKTQNAIKAKQGGSSSANNTPETKLARNKKVEAGRTGISKADVATKNMNAENQKKRKRSLAEDDDRQNQKKRKVTDEEKLEKLQKLKKQRRLLGTNKNKAKSKSGKWVVEAVA